MSDFEVTGTEQFVRLSKALKEAGRTGTRKNLNKRLKKATRPLIKQSREAALRELPKSGGLAALIARTPQRVQVRTGRDPGVRIVVGKNKSGARGANRGKVRHPVHGTDVWVEQDVPAGWFDDTMRAGASVVMPELERAVQDTIDEVIRGAK